MGLSKMGSTRTQCKKLVLGVTARRDPYFHGSLACYGCLHARSCLSNAMDVKIVDTARVVHERGQRPERHGASWSPNQFQVSSCCAGCAAFAVTCQ